MQRCHKLMLFPAFLLHNMSYCRLQRTNYRRYKLAGIYRASLSTLVIEMLVFESIIAVRKRKDVFVFQGFGGKQYKQFMAMAYRPYHLLLVRKKVSSYKLWAVKVMGANVLADQAFSTAFCFDNWACTRTSMKKGNKFIQMIMH